MLNHYEFLSKHYALGIYDMINRIDRDPSSPGYGLVCEYNPEVADAAWYYTFAFSILLCYYIKGEACYRDEKILDAVDVVLDAGERMMHDDGTVDLHVTNFHDPSYCGFSVRDALGPMLDVIKKYTLHAPLEDKIEARLISMISRMGKAMEQFGFHTPNHRWIICSALSYVYKFTGDEKALDTMNKYLWEGIDCDEYGEYTERSTGVYNLICNRSFLFLAHTTGDKKYLEYPARNMRLMHSFYEPDKTICTMNSMRQDRGKTSITSDIYYTIYLPLALYTRDPEFAYYSDSFLRVLMGEAMKSESPYIYRDAEKMYWFLMHEEWQNGFEDIPSCPPTRNRDIYLPDSGIARIYRDDATVTVVRSNSPDFFKLQTGKYSISARFAGSFFGAPHSQFRPKTMEKTEKGFKLISNEVAGYRSQFDEPPETSVWRHMDHSKRHIINMQSFDVTADVAVDGRTVTLDIEYGGADTIPIKLELMLDSGCRFETENVSFTSHPSDYIFLRSGKATITFDAHHKIEIDGGAYAHSMAENMRGAEHVPEGCFTICLTGKTPGKMHLTFKF